MLPRFENFVELDPAGVVDAWGIPVLKVTISWSENEKNMIPDMADSAAEMMEAGGAKNIRPFQVPNRIPGYGIHELGTRADGRRPEDVGPEPVLPVARREEPVRHGRRGVRVRRLPEPDADDHGAGGASSDYLMEQMKKGEI